MEPLRPWDRLKKVYASAEANPAPVNIIPVDQQVLISQIVQIMDVFFRSEESLDRLRQTGLLSGIFSTSEKNTLTCREFFQIKELAQVTHFDDLEAQIKKEFDAKKIIRSVGATNRTLTVHVSNCQKILHVNSNGELINESEGVHYHTHPAPKTFSQRIFYQAERECNLNMASIAKTNAAMKCVFMETNMLSLFQAVQENKGKKIRYSIKFNFGFEDNVITGMNLRDIVTLIKRIKDEKLLPMAPKCRFYSTFFGKKDGIGKYLPAFSGPEDCQPCVIITYTLFDPKMLVKL